MFFATQLSQALLIDGQTTRALLFTITQPLAGRPSGALDCSWRTLSITSTEFALPEIITSLFSSALSFTSAGVINWPPQTTSSVASGAAYQRRPDPASVDHPSIQFNQRSIRLNVGPLNILLDVLVKSAN